MAYGHDYKQALKDFTLFAGKIPLLPRYAFGFWWSCQAYSDHEMRAMLANFERCRIPLDALLPIRDWHHTRPAGKAGPDDRNEELFPDYRKIPLGYLGGKGPKVTLNLHPADGVKPFEAAYEAMRGARSEYRSDHPKADRVDHPDKPLIRSLFRRI